MVGFYLYKNPASGNTKYSIINSQDANLFRVENNYDAELNMMIEY